MFLKKNIERYFDRPLITDLLHPFAFEDGVFLLKDGSLGLIWEIERVSASGSTPAEIQGVSTAFASFLKLLPEETIGQIITISWRGLEKEELNPLKNGDLGNDHIKQYMMRKIQLHERGIKDGFAQSGDISFFPKTIKTYLTIRQKPLYMGGLYDKDSLRETLEKIKTIQRVVDASLPICTKKHRSLDVDGLIVPFYRILNPDRSSEIPPPEYKGGDIRKYMVFNSPESDLDGWSFETKRFSMISFASNPAGLEGEDANGNPVFSTTPNILFKEVDGVSLYDLAPEMLFCINFYIPSQSEVKRKLSFKQSMAFLHKFNFLGDTAMDKEVANRESKNMLALMYGGEKVVRAGYHLCIPSARVESSFSAARIANYLNIILNCDAFVEDLIAPGIFMRSLPFGFDPESPNEEQFVRRAVTSTASIIADVSPIYGTGRGSKTEVAANYYNRRGESLWLDLFDKDNTSPTSPHCLVTGATGSGKSVWIYDFIHQVMRQPATVFVIEKGRSQKKLCHLYGGQYIDFSGEPEFKLDPFNGKFDDDHRAFLTSIVSTMATGGIGQISREEVSVISEAGLSLATSSEKTMGEMVNTLRSYNDPVSVSLAKKLFQFYGSGQYARYVEGDKPCFNPDSKLTVVELGDLDMYPDLQAVIVSLLMFYINEYVKKIPGRKYLILDEPHVLFKNETSLNCLITAVLTYRKYGCSIVFSVQQPDQFKHIAKALNMRDNCPNKILFYQEADVIKRVADDLDLGPGVIDLFKTISKSDKYSEALMVAQKWAGVARTVLDRESYWGATTSESEQRLLEEMVDSGMTLREAIKAAAQKG